MSRRPASRNRTAKDPKTEKSPAAVRPPGELRMLGNMILADPPQGYGSNVQIIIAAHTSNRRSRNMTAIVSRCPARPSAVASNRSKGPRLGKRCDAGIVVAECLAQNVLCVLAQQGRGDWVGDRRQVETEWRFDIGDRACGGVRNLAEAMALAYFRRVECFFDGTKITDGDVG